MGGGGGSNGQPPKSRAAAGGGEIERWTENPGPKRRRERREMGIERDIPITGDIKREESSLNTH